MLPLRNPGNENRLGIYGRTIYIVAVIFTIGMFIITTSVLLAAPRYEALVTVKSVNIDLEHDSRREK